MPLICQLKTSVSNLIIKKIVYKGMILHKITKFYTMLFSVCHKNLKI
jgi:hypothetical protein